MSIHKLGLILRSLPLAVCALALAAPVPADAAWQPEKEVTLVIPYAPGGGTDVIGRILVKVVNENNLSPVPWVAVNRAGGGGLVGMKYVIDRAGDKHTITLVTSTGVVTSKLQGSVINWRKLTPISNLILDPQFLATHTESGFKSIKDVIDFAKKNPTQLRVAGATIGSEDSLCALMMQKYAGVETQYVAFEGGGDVRKNLMGGHVHVGWLNPSEMEGLMVKDGGKIVPLAVALNEPFPAYPDVPTFASAGYPGVVFDLFFRGILGAPDIDPEVAAFYDGIIGKAVQHPEYKEALDKGKIPALYLNTADFGKAIERWDASLGELVPLVKAIQK
ncbi:MAG: tripartite tricarboxylate transporter substrate binding protein [Rhodospirillales bacterium]|nr:tripartite tricarboxylate transporter substrate binding protein [Rhodospirillales bacterium]